MKLELKKYKEQLNEWPRSGHHIMAQYDHERIIVYQSYRPEIGNWDPDHDPQGNKLERRAVQIGIRNEETARYSKEDILEIEGISEFVKEQRQHVLTGNLDELITPKEEVLLFDDDKLNQRIGLSHSKIEKS